jgi:hypothetical protein
LAPQTGVSTFKGNTADTKGNGVDITLNSRNLDGTFKWYTNFLFSYTKDVVTKYLLTSTNTASDYLTASYSSIPTVGKPLYGIYSYKWGGLDPQTGGPQGYLNGQLSKDYASIIAAATPQNLIYNGSARPTMFGSLRNTFSYKRFSLSANISYRLGYYVRRASVQYATVLSGLGGHGDYELRWQKPGDEAFTQVPSIPATIDNNRDSFYAFSSVLVEKGDNVRLQDFRISYNLTKADIKRLPFRSVQIYSYAANLGILWKAAKNKLDPDAVDGTTLPVQKTIAFGIKTEF